MDKMRNVAVIVGSLRKDSINRKVANALVELAPAGLKLGIVEIGQLPLYNQDYDEKFDPGCAHVIPIGQKLPLSEATKAQVAAKKGW